MESVIEGLASALLPTVVSFASNHPIVFTIAAVIGVLRLIFKPIIAIARAIADATPSPSDNKIIDDIEASPITKAVLFVLDLVASIKPVKK